jgi:NADH-quinone oxidoreductase subunit J
MNLGDWISQPVNWVFTLLALASAYSGVRVVTSQNVIRAALFLVGALASSAGLFLLLSAEFVALTLVLVYIGAVIVLFLFGIMITRAPLGRDVALDHKRRAPAAITSIILFAVLSWASIRAFAGREVTGVGDATDTGLLGEALLGRFVVPFEVVSFLLLAALIGGITLARKDLSPRRGRSARGDLMLVNQFLILAALLFSLGVYGLLVRRNAVMVLLAVELMLNAVNINLIAFESLLQTELAVGQVFSIFVITVAAAEVGIGLAIILMIFRNRSSANVDDFNLMRL